jgi:hypothetical protein
MHCVTDHTCSLRNPRPSRIPRSDIQPSLMILDSRHLILGIDLMIVAHGLTIIRCNAHSGGVFEIDDSERRLYTPSVSTEVREGTTDLRVPDGDVAVGLPAPGDSHPEPVHRERNESDLPKHQLGYTGGRWRGVREG